MSGESAKARVLYVDDDEDNRTMFQHAFSPDFAVETCASGEEALGRVEAAPPQAVVTDQRMPGMTGVELLERVREVAPAARRLLVSAFDDPEPKAHLDGCVQAYFQKPWARDDLISAMRPEPLSKIVARAEAEAERILAELDRVLAEDEERRRAWVARTA